MLVLQLDSYDDEITMLIPPSDQPQEVVIELVNPGARPKIGITAARCIQVHLRLAKVKLPWAGVMEHEK